VNDAKEGSKPEPKELEHGPKLIADRTLGGARMLLISKPDRIVARDTLPSLNINIAANDARGAIRYGREADTVPDLWQRHNSPHLLRLDRSRLGRVLSQ